MMNRLAQPISSHRDAPMFPLCVQGWHSEHPIFEQLIEAVRPSLIIEVGTYLGASAIRMATVARRLNLSCQIICIDTWLGSEEFYYFGAEHPAFDLYMERGYPRAYDRFVSNVIQSGVQEMITTIPLPSRQAARILQREGMVADLVYLDGAHDYDEVRDDLLEYWPLTRPGGVLFGDDYTVAGLPGVKRAVDDSGLPVTIHDPFWVAKKPEERTT